MTVDKRSLKYKIRNQSCYRSTFFYQCFQKKELKIRFKYIYLQPSNNVAQLNCTNRFFFIDFSQSGCVVPCVLSRDQMGTVEVKVSSGQVDVSKEKNLLVWDLGNKSRMLIIKWVKEGAKQR